MSGGAALAVAAFEGLVTGDGTGTWHPGLKKPRWQIPPRASVAVGLAVYGIGRRPTRSSP